MEDCITSGTNQMLLSLQSPVGSSHSPRIKQGLHTRTDTHTHVFGVRQHIPQAFNSGVA